MIKAAFVIIRPVNVLISMLSVYLGGLISFDKYFDSSLAAACLSAGLIAAFGNICNDMFDIEIDRRSKPFRPLPSGKLTLKQALVLALVLSALGLILAAAINVVCLLIASWAAIALLVYTPVFKGKGYLGNLLVALIAAMAFFYGAAAVGYLAGGLIPALFALLFHFSREIIKDMEDYDADKAQDVLTGAVKYGFGFSKTAAGLVMLLLIAGTFVPYFMGLYGATYLILVILGTDIFLLYFLIRLLGSPDRKACRFIAGFMKAVMPLGLLAVFIGSRGW